MLSREDTSGTSWWETLEVQWKQQQRVLQRPTHSPSLLCLSSLSFGWEVVVRLLLVKIIIVLLQLKKKKRKGKKSLKELMELTATPEFLLVPNVDPQVFVVGNPRCVGISARCVERDSTFSLSCSLPCRILSDGHHSSRSPEYPHPRSERVYLLHLCAQHPPKILPERTLDGRLARPIQVFRHHVRLQTVLP